MKHRIVITGSPRSGTKFAAALLRAAGVKCTHETIFEPASSFRRVVQWLESDEEVLAESSWFAWPFASALQGDVRRVHLVRDPWATIDSLANRSTLFTEQAPGEVRVEHSMMPLDVPRAHPLLRAALFFGEWTYRIRRELCGERVRLEDLREDGPLAWFFGDVLRVRPSNLPRAIREAFTARDREIERQGVIRLAYGGERLRRSTREEMAEKLPRHVVEWINEYATAWGYS